MSHHEEPEYGYFTLEQRKELLTQIMAATSPDEVVGLIEDRLEGIQATVDEGMLQNAYSVGFNTAVNKYGNVEEITKLRQEHDVIRIAVAELLRLWSKGAEKGGLYHAMRKIEEVCEL